MVQRGESRNDVQTQVSFVEHALRQAASLPATEQPLCVYCMTQHSGDVHSPINTHMQGYK